jgi:riboflavin kinase/FMN adenylyltransferase
MTFGADIRRVLALGFFDGVHLGHAALLRRTVLRAAAIGAVPAVMTFDNHPDTLLRGEAVPLINSAPARAQLIREGFGIDSVIFLQFTEETMRIPWTDFIQALRTELGAVHFVVGHDFRFGWHGEGTAEKLTAYCAENGLGCDVISQITLDGVPISSSYIRQLLLDGRLREANRFLGHPHVLIDVVRYGYRLGSRLGAPTINMRFPEGVLALRRGVYAAKVRLPDGDRLAVTNVGVRPTVCGGEDLSVESYILDFSGNLYGKTLCLEFHEYLREERRFEDVSLLRAQIDRDVMNTRDFFGSLSC